MGSPEKAVSLLLEKDPGKRDKLAADIIAMNEERKKRGEDNWSFAEPLAEKNMETYGGKLAVAYGPEIFRGVTGILAQRLCRRFRVPAIAVAFGEHTCTGSLRSVRGYDLRAIMEQCGDLFIDWGGHNFAAGFSLEKLNWDPFLERLRLNAPLIELAEDTDEETVMVDAELPPAFLTPDVLKIVDRFEPYGEENRPLIFLSRNLQVKDINFVGREEIKHVKMTLDTGKHKWPAMYWQASEKVERDFGRDDKVDLVFNLSRDWYKGVETPQIMVTDLKRSGEA
jgi:single-stranded-DNA-specific exonuclease